MKKMVTLAFPLFCLIALTTGTHALAAKPLAPVAAEAPSGIIEFLDLSKNIIVISDMEYLLSDKITINGKSGGARQSLQKGMRVRFAFSFANGQGRPVISEISTGH